MKCCNGDPIELLKFLDVETYESVGESVMKALLNAELVKVQDSQSIRQLIVRSGTKNQGLYLLCQFFSCPFICSRILWLSCHNFNNPISLQVIIQF